MENNIKPIECECPKCQGFYDWTEDQGRCIICGYRWNPAIDLPKMKFPHCSFGACLAPIERIDRIFCMIHQGEIVDAVVRQKIGHQRRIKTKVERHAESQIRFNTPVMVRLKKNRAKT